MTRYLACTEEGYIHKCSCSYNEQVLETYTGHNVSFKININCYNFIHVRTIYTYVCYTFYG